MTSLDIFDACSKIADALSTLSDEQVKKTILMALIAINKQQLLIDPQEIMIKAVTVPKCLDDDKDSWPMNELIKFAHAYQKKYNRLLLIVGMEIYEHGGQKVRLTHANEHGEELTAANSFEDILTVNREDLTIRQPLQLKKDD